MLRRRCGQNTGREATTVARSTSRIERMQVYAPYQLGSKVGDVVARVWTIRMNRIMEQMTELNKSPAIRTLSSKEVHSLGRGKTCRPPSMYKKIIASRDLNSSSAVNHIVFENTGIASTAMSMTILQAPWAISTRVSPLLHVKIQGSRRSSEKNKKRCYYTYRWQRKHQLHLIRTHNV